jgi:hypothetical protein
LLIVAGLGGSPNLAGASKLELLYQDHMMTILFRFNSSIMAEKDSVNNELILQFRAITSMMNILQKSPIKAVNQGAEVAKDVYHDKPPASSPSRELLKLLGAMSTLLVRRNEVVAVACDEKDVVASANNGMDDDDDGSESGSPPHSMPGAVRHRDYIISANTDRRKNELQNDPEDALYYAGEKLEPSPHHCPPRNVSIDLQAPLEYVADKW